MSGAHHKLDNLICLVDFNNQQPTANPLKCFAPSR